MKFSRSELLNDLSADIRAMLLSAEKLKLLDNHAINQLRSDGGWSVAQAFNHLNIYSSFYLNVFERALGRPGKADGEYKSGWLGDYFTRIMLPQQNGKQFRKMKAPLSARPGPGPFGNDVIEQFISDQHRLLDIVHKARTSDLGTRIPISLTKMIRLKLGDGFRFFVAHERRHLAQVQKLLLELKADRV